jgi:hypothetical protein
MSERIRWFPLAAILSLIGAGVAAPAKARDGINTFGMAGVPSRFAVQAARPFVRNGIVTPRIPTHNANARNNLHHRRHAQMRSGLPITIWPYSSFGRTTTIYAPPIQSEVPPPPPVVVVSGLPTGVPERRAPETPPDYTYVAGCRAIPNGYHCDIAHDGTAASPGG